jgi:Rieske 2Fe-2S family protein
MDDQAIRELIDSQPGMTALQQAFYTDPDIYQRDVNEVYLKSWVYAGHLSEISKPGDWFLFDMAGESVVIVRSSESGVSALLNVCRHRGSRVCAEQRGCSRKLVCRYHGWSYNLDGSLYSAAHMGEGFDASAISLKKIHVEILEGMIFINFASDPAPFTEVKQDLVPCLQPYRLDRAKVAHRQSYRIDANWKLAVENYSECYHCAPSHPEYSRGHSLAKPGARESEMMAEVMSRAASCGLGEASVHRVYRLEPGFGTGYAYERYPLWRGHLTGSDDGQPVAPLLGDIKGYDGGTTDLQVGPVTFGLAYCDYVVIYRFTPLSMDQCECDITWLVNGDAEEGKDYDKARLTWLWDVTTLADKRIIEHNARGVKSRYYEPGPYSMMEEYTWKFNAWYLAAIRPGQDM